MIAIDGISFSYAKRKSLFNNLSLKIPAGRICGLLGKNGAGKTTLLKIICGLRFAQAGECKVHGVHPNKRLADFLADTFLIPEEIYLPSYSIAKYEWMHAPFYPRYNEDCFRNFLSEFGLSVDEKLGALSFGQKKKCLLSFALATNARLLLLDEPTNGLDIPSKSQFRKLLASTLTDDRTYIISTHQVRDLGTLIDPIIILHEGRIVFHREMEEITARLYMGIGAEESGSDQCLYSEKRIGGYTLLLQNTQGQETDMDIEMLFNAVISSPEEIGRLFEEKRGANE